jgi:hypothetical protein
MNRDQAGVKPVRKIFIIIGAVILLLVGGLYSYFQPKWITYTDSLNGVSLQKPETWQAGSIEGYVRVAENTADAAKPNVLIKIEYPESIIPALELDTAPEVEIAGKIMRRADHEREIPARPGASTSTVTYTHLLWTAPNGKMIIFEISPWQKSDLDPNVERILRSFTI